MGIYKGSTEIDVAYKGSTELENIYKGSQEIWTNAQAFDLGTGTSFNIKNLFPDLYSSLTADNFFFCSSTYTSIGGTHWYNGGSSSMGCTKSYNSSTGILTAYFSLYTSDNGGTSRTSPVRMYLVKDTSKIRYLGTGTGYSVASIYPSKYQSFTSENFVTSYLPSKGVSANYGTDVSYSKSYNQSSGWISFYGDWSTRDPDRSGSVSMSIYCIPKVKSI